MKLIAELVNDEEYSGGDWLYFHGHGRYHASFKALRLFNDGDVHIIAPGFTSVLDQSIELNYFNCDNVAEICMYSFYLVHDIDLNCYVFPIRQTAEVHQENGFSGWLYVDASSYLYDKTIPSTDSFISILSDEHKRCDCKLLHHPVPSFGVLVWELYEKNGRAICGLNHPVYRL